MKIGHEICLILDTDGILQTVEYIADDAGFRYVYLKEKKKDIFHNFEIQHTIYPSTFIIYQN